MPNIPDGATIEQARQLFSDALHAHLDGTMPHELASWTAEENIAARQYVIAQKLPTSDGTARTATRICPDGVMPDGIALADAAQGEQAVVVPGGPFWVNRRDPGA